MKHFDDSITMRDEDIRLYREGRSMVCWRHPDRPCTILCPMLQYNLSNIWFNCAENRGGLVVAVRMNGDEDNGSSDNT